MSIKTINSPPQNGTKAMKSFAVGSYLFVDPKRMMEKINYKKESNKCKTKAVMKPASSDSPLRTLILCKIVISARLLYIQVTFAEQSC